MDALEEIQVWYISQCNGDWEHKYGINITTLDNPGWSFQVDLTDTELDGLEFKENSYRVGVDADTSGNNWMECKVANNKFIGYGGPEKLEEIIKIFLNWAKH